MPTPTNWETLFSSNSGEWETPQPLFNSLYNKYSLEFDLAATKGNSKCSEYYTAEDNALIKDWHKIKVSNYKPWMSIHPSETKEYFPWLWLNPPYGRNIKYWVEKCYKENLLGATICLLIPARTDTKYFHEYVMDKAHEVILIKGRLKFNLQHKDGHISTGCSAPFPSMVCVYHGYKALATEFKAMDNKGIFL